MPIFQVTIEETTRYSLRVAAGDDVSAGRVAKSIFDGTEDPTEYQVNTNTVISVSSGRPDPVLKAV